MRRGQGKDAAGHILQELIKYTDYHFANEERAFDAYGYPRTAEHKKQHSDLIKQLGEQLIKFQKGELGISISMLDFLVSWVTTHIMKEDMLYVPFLKDKKLDF
jgi:hemerythrin-like metal-binding protein